MSKYVRKEDAIVALRNVWNALWEIDIPSPTVPEYIEHHEQVQQIMKMVQDMIDTLPYTEFNTESQCESVQAQLSEGGTTFKWIPIKSRQMDEEERKEWSERLGYDIEYEDAVIFVSQMPDDGQEVLTCNQWGHVRVDTYYDDDGCYFEENGDMDGIIAWMPLPEPYKEDEGISHGDGDEGISHGDDRAFMDPVYSDGNCGGSHCSLQGSDQGEKEKGKTTK